MGLGRPEDLVAGDRRGHRPLRLRAADAQRTPRRALHLPGPAADPQRALPDPTPSPSIRAAIAPPAREHSRGYLRHLIMENEILGARLASIHNLRFYLAPAGTGARRDREPDASPPSRPRSARRRNAPRERIARAKAPRIGAPISSLGRIAEGGRVSQTDPLDTDLFGFLRWRIAAAAAPSWGRAPVAPLAIAQRQRRIRGWRSASPSSRRCSAPARSSSW